MRVAYLSLQAVVEGQDSWAAVCEVIGEWESAGWEVDRWFASYDGGKTPSGVDRLREMRRLQRRLIEHLHECDALYIRNHPMAFLAAGAARKLGIPVIQECNGTYEDLFVAWPMTRPAKPLFIHLQRTQYARADLVFCGTEAQRRWLGQEAGRTDIVVSPNGANDVLFTPDAPRRPGLPDRFAIFFGQFATWQGIRQLIEAGRLPQWPDDVKLVFVGHGVDQPLVEAAVAEDPEKFEYAGRLPYGELPGVIAHSIASFSPQYTPDRAEAGFSALKVYESMACGVPVIGADNPGVGDVIRHYNCGITVEPGNAAQMAEALAHLVSHPEEAADMGRRGRAAIEAEASWRARARQRREAIANLAAVRARMEARARP